MEQSYLARAAKYVSDRHKRQNWQRVVSGLCAVVVFCTVYALILPAITLTAPLTCGLEEHQHGAGCYETSGPVALLWQQVCSEESVYADVPEGERYAPFVLHVHNELCYRDGSLICAFPEVVPHIHNEECWIDVLDDLICGLEETPEGEIPAGHVHAPECYAEVLACGLEESAPVNGHVHDESCYTTETVPGSLICGNTEEDHQHDESCYSASTETSYLTCGLEESAPTEGHTHTPDCYEMQLVCGQEESEAAPVHVHTEACYASKERVELCFDPKVAHEHIPLRYNEYGEAINADAACYDAYGVLTCTKWVTREHVHTEACFQEVEDPAAEPVQVLTCEITEHTHEDSCYTQEEPEEPEEPVRQDDQWDAIFWSDVVAGSSDVVLDAWTNGSWMDTAAMDPELLAQMRAAGEADLTRALQSSAIQVGSQAYDSALHGPMDPGRDFSIMLTWSLNSNSFTGMTYTYQFPWQISVENVEKRVLNDAGGNQALAYSVWNNTLTVTYYAPAESVTTGFSLRASWSGDMGAETVIQWSRSDSTYVVFAEPELTVEKTMGEDGLRVAEDGTVWADYTVTVTNSGMVAASEITLTDVLEAERFTFAQGAYEDGMDYIVTVGGRDSYETFPAYDGGDTVTFPVFGLESGESRVFQYMAVMSAEDRAAVDAAVKASADPTQAGETVRNTATAVCRAFSGDLEFTSMSRATYGGPDSKHVENFTQVYETGAFNVSFTVNGDAQLPLGMTTEKLERTTGEGLQLTVETLDETTEEYMAFAQNVEEDAELLDLQVLQIDLNYNGVKLELEDCDVTATVTPTEALLNYQKPHVVNYSLTEEEKEAAEAEKPLGDEGFGVILKAFAQDEEETETAIMPGFDAMVDYAAVPVVAGMMERGSIYIDRGDDPDIEPAAIEPITFSVENRMLAVQAEAKDYPIYNVEFWANLPRLDLLDSGNLKVIDTRANAASSWKAVLPSNGKGLSQKVTYLQVDENGNIQTKTEKVPLFVPKELRFNPNRLLTLEMFNVLEQFDRRDHNYDISAAYILNPDGTEKKLQLVDSEGNKIPLSMVTLDGLAENDTVKLEFDSVEGSHTNAAVFYDYDITDGMIYTTRDVDSNGNVVLSGAKNVSEQATLEANGAKPYLIADTRQKGINNPDNYSGSGVKFAFGNSNTGTQLQNLTWNSERLNRWNGSRVFQGCTFGLAAKYLVNGTLAFSDGIDAPNLFNQTGRDAKGKTTYDSQYALDFKRVGDTYTLRSVIGAESSAYDLDLLWKQGYKDEDGNNTIFTNEFWPMDCSPYYGADGHDFKFGSLVRYRYRVRWDDGDYLTDPDHKRLGGTTEDDFPPSDFPEGRDADVDHNSYFGLQFSVKFSIPEGYIGPLDYCFFGDDDLWLYLNGELVCDIGGVHSSVGEYVDLSDYIAVRKADGTKDTIMMGGKPYTKLKSGTYQLDLFYDERGASGSTCWMQYTLPGIQSVPIDTPPESQKANLKVEKTVNGVINEGTQFNFVLDLTGSGTYKCRYFGPDGFELSETDRTARGLPAEITAASSISQTAGTRFNLRANEYLLVEGVSLPATYKVEEVGDNAKNTYETTIETFETGLPVVTTTGKVATGSLKAGTTIHVNYTNTFYYALPETGGAGTSGTAWYTMGALPVMTAAVLVYKKKSRKKGGTYS